MRDEEQLKFPSTAAKAPFSADTVRFADYELDRARCELSCGEERVALNRKTFDLLIYLIDHADRVVTKEELLQTLWPKAFVEESNLTQQIFLLRRALSRHKGGAKIIETVSGRGYRFVAPLEFATPPTFRARPPHDPLVSTDDAKKPVLLQQEANAAEHKPRGLLLLATCSCAMLLAAVLLLELRVKLATHPAVTTYTPITHDGHAKFLGGTDGNRIYFTELEKSRITQVSVAGGAQVHMQVPLQSAWSNGVSPDGSTLLLVSQASGQGPQATLWSYSLIGGSLRRLRPAVCAAWSPDEDRIVYATAEGGLFLMRSDGSETQLLAAPGGYIKSVAWSPDGQTIRFSKDGLLWQLPARGGSMQQLLPGWGRSHTQWSGGWAGDGSYVFAADGQLWMLERQNSFGWMPPRAAHPVQLTFGPTTWDQPSLSRDGESIFAVGQTWRGTLVRFPSRDKPPEPAFAGLSAEFVCFSRDALLVAYVSYPEGVLWRARVDGSDPISLTRPPLRPTSIRWSPDGTKIVFVNHVDSVDHLFLVSADGTRQPSRLLPDDKGAEIDPSWSPDGKRLAFSTATNVGASTRSELRVLELATGKTTTIPGSSGMLVPRWSPDGRTLAAMTLDTEGMRLLHLRDGTWTDLQTGAVAFPEWSQDSRWIYYVRWTVPSAILRIRISDGKQETVADLQGAHYTGTYTLWMGLTPEDVPLMLRDEGTEDIYALHLERR